MWWYIKIGTCKARTIPSGVGRGIGVAEGVGVSVETGVAVGEGVQVLVGTNVMEGVSVGYRVQVGVKEGRTAFGVSNLVEETLDRCPVFLASGTVEKPEILYPPQPKAATITSGKSAYKARREFKRRKKRNTKPPSETL